MGGRRRSRHGSPPARARDRSAPGHASGERGAPDRGCPRDAAGHRVGDRRGRHALDPPGQADDRAATRRVVGIAGAGGLHPDAPIRRVDWRAGHPALRVLAADGHGGPHARLLPGGDRPDRTPAVPRRGQRLVFLLDQLHLGRRLPPQLSDHAGEGHSLSTTHRGDHSADRSPQLSGRRADVARGPAAALPSLGRRCRRPRRDPACRRPAVTDRRAGRARR